MYSGVPQIERSSASRTPVTRRAMPKSTILTDVDAGAALVDDDVVALRSAWTTPARCASSMPASDWHDDVDHALDAERVLVDQELGQRRALDVLHREVEQAVGRLAVVDDRDAVGMVQARRAHRLVAEPRDHPRVGAQLLVEDLDRDGAAERDLVGLVDGAAAADADAGGQLELVAEDSADELQRLLDLVLHAVTRRYPGRSPSV